MRVHLSFVRNWCLLLRRRQPLFLHVGDKGHLRGRGPDWPLFRSLLAESSDSEYLAKVELQVWVAMWQRSGLTPLSAVVALDHHLTKSLPIIYRLTQART